MATALMHDLGEIYRAWRDAILQDADIVAVLGETDGVDQSMPQALPSLPLITLELTAANPVIASTSTQVWLPEFMVRIFDTDTLRMWSIHGILVDHWSIPNRRTVGLESQHFQFTTLRNLSATSTGMVRLNNSDEAVMSMACEWRGRVIPRS